MNEQRGTSRETAIVDEQGVRIWYQSDDWYIHIDGFSEECCELQPKDRCDLALALAQTLPVAEKNELIRELGGYTDDDEAPVWLPQLFEALGWQGGTAHQAIAAVARLVSAAQQVAPSVSHAQIDALIRKSCSESTSRENAGYRFLIAMCDLIGGVDLTVPPKTETGETPLDQEKSNANSREKAPEPITAVYPHRVSPSGRCLTDEHGTLLFAGHYLEQWETTVCKKLDRFKQYEMHIEFREVNE